MMKAVLAWTLARAGRADEARGVLAEIESGSGGAFAYQRATVLAALGEREAALASLEQAAAARDPWSVLIGVDPMLDPLRGDPRLASLAARVRRSAG